jgi:hypothetical protein
MLIFIKYSNNLRFYYNTPLHSRCKSQFTWNNTKFCIIFKIFLCYWFEHHKIHTICSLNPSLSIIYTIYEYCKVLQLVFFKIFIFRYFSSLPFWFQFFLSPQFTGSYSPYLFLPMFIPQIIYYNPLSTLHTNNAYIVISPFINFYLLINAGD